MFVQLEKGECCGCSACVQRCPTACISMQRDEEGFLYPRLDNPLACVDCGLCRQVCPALAQRSEPRMFEKAYMGNARDENLRVRSASGGIFGVLARSVLAEDGVVFGARFDADFRVIHDCARNEAELESLLGSKYAQSDLKDSFARAKAELKAGRKVLFSGLPCQIEGLRRYLNKDYENLLTVDLFCYGVQSPAVWDAYLKSRGFPERRIASINMRSKRFGWKKYAMEIAYEDGGHYLAPKGKDAYLKSYSRGLFVRSSCHSCRYKGFPRMSDLTIGDFWEVNEVFPRKKSRSGVSIIIANSGRGEAWLEKSGAALELEAVNMPRLMEMQPGYLKPCAVNRNRKAFMEGILSGESIEALADRYVTNSMKRTLVFEVKKLLFRTGLWRYVRSAWNGLKRMKNRV